MKKPGALFINWLVCVKTVEKANEYKNVEFIDFTIKRKTYILHRNVCKYRLKCTSDERVLCENSCELAKLSKN